MPMEGEYARATNAIDYNEHGTIKLGELCIVLHQTEDGEYRVKWLNKHRKMSGWGNMSFVRKHDIEEAPAPVFLTRNRQIVCGAIIFGVVMLAWATPHWGHHYLSSVSPEVVERMFVEHAPRHITRVVDENGMSWCVTYERIEGRHMRELARRGPLSPEQVEAELKRLAAS